MRTWSSKHETWLLKLVSLNALATIALASCTISTNEIKTINDGDTVYRGQTHSGKREGLGVLYQGDSTVYSGMWHNGMRQGRGTASDHDGEAHRWRLGSRHARHGNSPRLHGHLRGRDGQPVSRQRLWQVHRQPQHIL